MQLAKIRGSVICGKFVLVISVFFDRHSCSYRWIELYDEEFMPMQKDLNCPIIEYFDFCRIRKMHRPQYQKHRKIRTSKKWGHLECPGEIAKLHAYLYRAFLWLYLCATLRSTPNTHLRIRWLFVCLDCVQSKIQIRKASCNSKRVGISTEDLAKYELLLRTAKEQLKFHFDLVQRNHVSY